MKRGQESHFMEYAVVLVLVVVIAIVVISIFKMKVLP